MALTIPHTATANAVAAATTQPGWVSALVSAWAGGDVTARFLTAAAVVMRVQTYSAFTADNASTPRAGVMGGLLATTELAQGTPALIEFVQGSTVIFTISAGVGTGDFSFAGQFISGSRPRLDAVDGLPAIRFLAPASLPLTAPPPAPSPPAPTPPAPAPSPPTTMTLTGSSSGVTGEPSTVTATLNALATAAVTVTPAAVAGVTFSTPAVIAIGQTSTTYTQTRATDGTHAVAATTSPSLSVTGFSFTSAASGWVIADNGTVDFARNTTTILRTGLAGTETIVISPDLAPGLTVSIVGGNLQVVGDATVPDLSGAVSGSPEDAVSARDIAIEVLENPVATIRNVTQNITYEPSGSYAGRTGSNPAGRWNAVMHEASNNDVIEISPSAQSWPGGEGSIYYSTNLDSTVMAIWKPCTVRGIAGRGRWKPGEPTRTAIEQDRNGITIYSPQEIGVRGSFTVADFEHDNWGRFATSFGFRVRVNATQVNDWVDMHQAVTVRNFKMGRPPYERSASGFAGDAQTWTIEDGHVYDTGTGANASFVGADHNFYIGGQYLYMRGVRSQRSRAHSLDGTSAMDGHHAKTTFNYATVEASVFDCGPNGDSSIQLQCKGGGNLVVRGCLFIAGPKSRTATGAIVFEREEPGTNDGKWTYGLAGHSVLVERSAFVNHRAYAPPTDQRAFVYFRPTGHPWRIASVSPVVVRDNIGISTVPSDVWIANDPTAGATWTGRGNTARAYNKGEWAFKAREILGYLDALGAPAAGEGSVAVPQFVYPHGYRSVTRSTQGLG